MKYPRLPGHRRWFWVAVLFELGLLGLATLCSWLFNLRLFADARWTWAGAGLGLAGTLPLILMFWWLMQSPIKAFAEIREFFDETVRPMFGQWSIPQLVILSILAGLCEEVLFRSILQGGLAPVIGIPAALIAASLLFGFCHWITPAYAFIAALMGLYLGALWIVSGNLLAPIVTHALYDFIALYYLLRAHPGRRVI